jgi:photosystem II stability/assembly factor-like uncharacterized protein
MNWEMLPGTALGDEIDDRFNDIVVRGSRVWAVAKLGSIVRMADGALVDRTNIAGHPRSLGFDERGETGWLGLIVNAGTNATRLMKTTSGGDAWAPVAGLPRDPERGICGMSVLDAKTAFACGTFDSTTRCGVLRTEDGDCWEPLPLPTSTVNLVDVHFWDRRWGLAAGGHAESRFGTTRPVVLRTRDGGRYWEPARIHGELPPGSYCWKIFFLDELVGFVSVASTGSYGPFILKTTDAGETWRAMKITAYGQTEWDLQGIGFANAKRGWVGQFSGPVYETVNGGDSWQPIDLLSDLNRVRLAGDAVYASGDAMYRRPRDR